MGHSSNTCEWEAQSAGGPGAHLRGANACVLPFSTMRTLLLSALMLVASSASAAEKAPPAAPAKQLAPAEEPTAYACSAQTLLTGKPCAFEGEERAQSASAGEQKKLNRQVLTTVAEKGCRDVAKAGPFRKMDVEALARCKRQFGTAAENVCELEDGGALVDNQGRFVPGARECYEALGQVLSAVRTDSELAAACCDCLSQSCKTPEPQCRNALVREASLAPAKSCARQACPSSCAAMLPAAPAEKESESGVRTSTQEQHL